ncbi:MAG: putative toxin-antitoxin system toxin component, PIN family [Gemmataceae bacterium]
MAVERIVLDTNILVGSAYAPGSASRRLVDACLAGELCLVLSPALMSEYDFILARAVRRPGLDEIWQRLKAGALLAEPVEVPRLVPEDPDDDKLLATARAGAATALITSDHHLLRLDPYEGIRIMRPGPYWEERSRAGG